MQEKMRARSINTKTFYYDIYIYIYIFKQTFVCMYKQTFELFISLLIVSRYL